MMNGDLFRSMTTASSGMEAQGLRLRLISENVANADTPNYHRKMVGFESEFDRASGAMRVVPGRMMLDRSPPTETYEPGHPLADERGMVLSSNVDPLVEMVDAREAQRSYEANLNIFDQARRMYSGLLDLIRR